LIWITIFRYNYWPFKKTNVKKNKNILVKYETEFLLPFYCRYWFYPSATNLFCQMRFLRITDSDTLVYAEKEGIIAICIDLKLRAHYLPFFSQNPLKSLIFYGVMFVLFKINYQWYRSYCLAKYTAYFKDFPSP